MDNKTEYSIFLHIIEGIGFNEKNEEISLTATLNGVKFEVEAHHTENTTVFNSNCIWECMADDLKRMKTDNRPIKLECFHKTLKNDKEVKKAIGFVLLPIRTLQMVKTVKNLQVKLHWHKLCGLTAEWRQSKPEIYLSAIITSKEIMESGRLEEVFDQKPDSSDSIYIRPSETSLMLKSQLGIFVNLLEDECLLQVGNGPKDCDTFIVTLTLKHAKNLEQLVGSGGDEQALFRFHYDFLGCPSDLNLVPNCDGLYKIQEKVSVKFKSSLESLKEYFRRVFYIPIDLYYNHSIIGNYKLRYTDFMPPSLEAIQSDNTWEVKDSFVMQTLFDVFDSSDRPTVEFLFSLRYIPKDPLLKSHRRLCIDKGARGDMGDDNDFFELPPTTVQPPEKEPQTRCQSYRLDRDQEKVTKTARSEPSVAFKPREDDRPPVNDIAYEVIAELEDWKYHQMDDFLAELKKKEKIHLEKLSAEWERQKKELTQRLQDKLDECSRLTETLEAAQKTVREKSLKQYEEERAFDNTKHELDKRYTIKFMEIEEKARRIKDEMDYAEKLQELRLKELKMEKDHQAEENAKLREKVAELEEELAHMRSNYLPREQLAGLFEDLRQQSERYAEMEKSKKFYKEQWAQVTKELHNMKLQSLKIQEEKLKQSSCINIENIKDLHSLIFREHAALLTDRSELKNIRDALTSDSDESKSDREEYRES